MQGTKLRGALLLAALGVQIGCGANLDDPALEEGAEDDAEHVPELSRAVASRDRDVTDHGADGAELECRSDVDCRGAGERCCEHVCVETSSCSFAVSSVEPAVGWQSGDGWLTLTGSGFVEGMRVYIGEGRAPVRVLDSTRATVLTPPGPEGEADVAIALGDEEAATLHGAFAYAAGGVAPPWETISIQEGGTPRSRTPAIAVLQDGRALITGGMATQSDFRSGQRSADLFGPSPDRAFVPVPSEMSAGRCWHAAVTLLTGKVLVVGGCWDPISGSGARSDTADLYDPETNSFEPTSTPMNVARGGLTLATLLVDGRVLIASGNDSSMEIYDPDADSFELVPHGTLHDGGFLVRLRDGRVLMGGGGGSSASPGNTRAYAEVFDSDTGEFTDVGSLAQPTCWAPAIALPDGRALVIGGELNGLPTAFTNGVEVFDPVTDTFSLAPYTLSTSRAGAAHAVLVRDGTVLAIGGDYDPHRPAPVDRIDPVSGAVTTIAGPLSTSGIEIRAVRLLDGSVLVAGGFTGDGSGCVDFLEYLPAAP